MSLQDAAIAALLFMVSFSGILLKILWNRSILCEQQSEKMHDKLEAQNSKIGVLEGTLKVMQGCSVKDCPFRSRALDTKPPKP